MKILIIGSPGSGKSVLTRRLKSVLEYPVLHLDRIYHTGTGKMHITREELVDKINAFSDSHENWIIDGNYIGTLEMRVNLADTVVILDMPPELCLSNACKRAEESKTGGENREDMAQGFDETLTEDFLDFIRHFRRDTLPGISKVLSNYPSKKIKFLRNYEEVEAFTNSVQFNTNILE